VSVFRRAGARPLKYYFFAKSNSRLGKETYTAEGLNSESSSSRTSVSLSVTTLAVRDPDAPLAKARPVLGSCWQVVWVCDFVLSLG